MLRFLLLRPVAVIMVTIGLCILGVVGARFLPVSLLPDVAIPRITVQLEYPGRSAREIEESAVRLLRNGLLQVGKLRDIRSSARNGSASIALEFAYGVNTNLVFIEVNEKIDQMIGQLPRDLARPRVVKANISDLPVFYLSVIPGRDAEMLQLSEFARSVLKRRIEQLPEVAFADLTGLSEPEILIQPDYRRLEGLNLTEQDLSRVLEENNLQLGGILLQDGHYQYAIRFSSRLQSLDDIRNLPMKAGERLINLGELATVELQASPARGSFRHNGRPALAMTIRKQADASLFALQDAFRILLDNLRKEYPELSFEVSNDQTELLTASIRNLLTSLGYGALFAFLILFLFFREWRTPALISMVVPVSLVIAFFGLYLAGISVNTISLAGLILGVGLMIDNSIIVIENIRQQLRLGLPPLEACALGADEVIRPLISSALTTCSVFLPLVFLSGLAGALFYDQAISITIALGASLLVAYVLLPVLVRLMSRRLTGKIVPEAENWLASAQTGWFARSVDWVMRYRYPFLAGVTALALGAFALLNRLPKEQFPKLTRQALELAVDWNENISLKENEARISDLLRESGGEVATSLSFAGEQQFLLEEQTPSINEARLFLYPPDGVTVEALGRHLSAWLNTGYPGAAFSATPIKNLFDQVFGQDQPDLVIRIQSLADSRTPAPEAVEPLTETLMKEGFQPAVPSVETQYAIRILQEKAILYNVPQSRIFDRLRALFNANRVVSLETGAQAIPVVLGADSPSFFKAINEAGVENDAGNRLPLSYFIEISKETGYKTITGDQTGEAYEVALGKYRPGVEAEVREWVAGQKDLGVHFTGQVFTDRNTIRELTAVFAVALALLYLILAAQFESLILPVVVLLAVPLGAAGSVAALWVSGQSLNLVSLIGITVMSGIVVNDAILKVDMIKRLRGQQYSLEEAIHGAGYRRIRPILMTTLTTVLALAPVLFSSGLGAELQWPLAWAVIGGLAVGTLSSLYVIPAIYRAVGDFRPGK